MIEKIQKLEQTVADEKLKEAFIEQMIRGYQEMAELNLATCEEWHLIDNEVDYITEKNLRQE